MRRIMTVAGLATLVIGGHALAELVYFKRGGQAQIPASVEGDRVRLETPGGPREFPKDDFSAIVPGYRPLEEWTARRAASIQDGSLQARFVSSWWALENGLTDEAIADLEGLRAIAPAEGPAARSIAAIDRLALPCPDPDLDPLRAQLRPLRFREVRSSHVLLFHQHTEPEARERLDVIEGVARTFHVVFASQGVELSGPTRRIVSVYFADRRDYVEFLRRSDADAFTDTQGYFHPILNAVFAFDTRSQEEQKAGRRALINLKISGERESELARRSLLLDLEWRTTDLGIAAHETVHQLTSESKLAPRFDDFPNWLHEGLAAQFEVVRGGRWAGFGRVHDLRLPDWRAIRPAPRLAPLLHDSGLGHGYRRDLYAESWALVFYLRKAHPREFLVFLDLLRTPGPDATRRTDRAYDAFRAAFGDLAGLESAWHQFLADLETPLESGKPKAKN